MTFDVRSFAYLDQPCEISLETFSQCNARCTFCPYPTLDRIGTRMSDNLIARLVDEMSEFVLPFAFSPFKVNEPLLDKRVIPLCEELVRRTAKATVRLFSNGSTLTPANIERIAELRRLDHLWVSLNATSKDEYERLMGLSFERTTDHLDALHRLVANNQFRHRVILSCVGHPNAEFVRYCANRWPLFPSFTIKLDSWIDFIKGQQPDVPDRSCSRWWELSIMATGQVSLCCMDGTGAYAIGDLNSQTLLDVYNTPSWRNRRLPDAKRSDWSPCNRCTY